MTRSTLIARGHSSLLASVGIVGSGGHVYAATVNVDASNVDEALAAAEPGDVLVFDDGTYDDVDLDITRSGTADQPITLRAESTLGVTFRGNGSTLAVSADWVIVEGFRWSSVQPDAVVIRFTGANNCIFRRNELVNTGRAPETKSGVIRHASSTNNLFERNRFDDIASMGPQVWAYDGDVANTGNVFRLNHFRNHEGLELLQLGQASQPELGINNDDPQYTIVEHNLFEDIGSVSEMISNKTSDNQIRHNTFRNCNDQVVLRLGRRVRVEGNWFFDSQGVRVHDSDHVVVNNYFEGPFGDGDTAAISLYSANHERPDVGNGNYYPVRNVLVAHNTIVDHGGGHLYLGGNHNNVIGGHIMNLAPSENTIRNNVIVNARGPAVYDRASESITWEGNIFHPTDEGTLGYSGVGVMDVDPMLDSDGRLQPGSPAIGAGVASADPIDDIDGQLRDESPDVGADEVSTELLRFRPLTGDDVGPESSYEPPEPSDPRMPDAGIDAGMDAVDSGSDPLDAGDPLDGGDDAARRDAGIVDAKSGCDCTAVGAPVSGRAWLALAGLACVVVVRARRR